MIARSFCRSSAWRRVEALLFTLLLTACSPNLSKVTQSGNSTGRLEIDGNMVTFEVHFWMTHDGQYAVLAVWDNLSDKFQEQFQYKYDQLPTPGLISQIQRLFGETCYLRKLTFSTTSQTVMFTGRDKLKPGICRLVYAKNGQIHVEECCQQEAVQLVERYMGNRGGQMKGEE